MKIKIPLKYVDMRTFASLLREDVEEWFKELGSQYVLLEEISYERSDMMVHTFIYVEDAATAVQFKLRWL